MSFGSRTLDLLNRIPPFMQSVAWSGVAFLFWYTACMQKNEAKETKLLISSCREFSPQINDAVDRLPERKFREALVSKKYMARFFFMPEKSITDKEFTEFQVFVQLAIQQLIIAAVERVYKLDRKDGSQKPLAEVVKMIDDGKLDIDPGTAVYHDVMHVLMHRLMSKGGRDVRTLRPIYLQREARPLHELVFGNKHNELNNMEERLATFFFNNNHKVSEVIAEVQKRKNLTEQEKVDLFVTRIFSTSGEIERARSMPQLMNFITKIFINWDTNPRIFYEEHRKLMEGLL